jgi:hypothetical protein
MSRDTAIEVTRIDAVPGTTIIKYPNNYSSSPNWGFEIIYTLSDGRTLTSTDKGYSRKKDAVAGLAKLPAIPPSNPTAIELKDDGSIYMVSTTFSFRSEEMRPAEGWARQFIVACANGHEPTADELEVAHEYVAQGPRIAAGEYLPNYAPLVAERLQTLVLDRINA